eukprot:TRINITY_DN11512_c0_g2_i2.p1 TRINITY_DN11512_c0_g2~~TRINITY_DN11512_c0_g2_i2.p1  ORF type:complete len:468 (-),score=124.32 TRINITY_DN11512_c0_g2_i2:28-1431(-)
MAATECLVCCKPISNEEKRMYRCPCKASKAHVKCITSEDDLFCPMCMKEFELRENVLSILELKTLCCGKEVRDKDKYLQSLIEVNDKKESKELGILCPLCSKTINRMIMETILTRDEIEHLIRKYTTRTCPECKKEIANEDFITLSCNHHYHVPCAKLFLAKDFPKCREEGCGKAVESVEEKLEECYKLLGRNCSYCGGSEDRFALLLCNHYICDECADRFYKGENRCFDFEKAITADCKICNRRSGVKNIVLQCNHVYNIGSDKPIEGSSQLRCKECRSELNDLEKFVLCGRRERSSDVKEEAKDLLLGVDFKELEDVHAKMFKQPYATKLKFKTPPIDRLKPAPHKSTLMMKRCTECKHHREGMYQFACEHFFICQTCIATSVPNQLLAHKLPSYCPECEKPINLSFVNFLSNANGSRIQRELKAWEKVNLKVSKCCSVSAVRKANGRFVCTGCNKEVACTLHSV